MPLILHSIVIETARLTALSCRVAWCVGYGLTWCDWMISSNVVVVPAVFGIDVDIIVDSLENDELRVTLWFPYSAVTIDPLICFTRYGCSPYAGSVFLLLIAGLTSTTSPSLRVDCFTYDLLSADFFILALLSLSLCCTSLLLDGSIISCGSLIFIHRSCRSVAGGKPVMPCGVAR